MLKIRLPRSLFDRMISHCRSEYPHEACGLLSGGEGVAGRIYEMPNAESSPVSYLVDPGAQFRAMKEMRENGERMVAIYHSHPQSRPYPSQKDISLAFYSDAVYIIVGLGGDAPADVRGYTILDGRVGEAGIEILP
ncbi:MAG: M67 family metallopeptidase [Nitrospiraceae bacterium]|nr:M67 family metallopeptidase [Nitrospiraceae bacterium]